MKFFLFVIFLFFPYFSLAHFEGEVYYNWLNKCEAYFSWKNFPNSLWFTFTQNWDMYYIKNWDLHKNHKIIKTWVFRFIWITSDNKILYSQKNSLWKEDIYEDITYITTFDRTWWVDAIKNTESDYIELYEDGTYTIIPEKYSLSWFINEVPYDFIGGKLVPYATQPTMRKFYSNNKKFSWEIITSYKDDFSTSFYIINGKKSQLYDTVDFLKISDNWDYWVRVREGDIYKFLFNGVEISSPQMDDFITEFHFINDQKVYKKILRTDSWNKNFLVIWETEFEYDEVYDIIEFPDKSWFYARVVKNGKDIWNINGEEFTQYDDLYYIIFSEKWDIIFVWKKDEIDILVKNGKEILSYDRIYAPQFYNWDKIFFHAKSGDKYLFVQDGIESQRMKEYDYLLNAPDYSRYVFENFDIWKTVFCEDISKVINISDNQREIIKKYFLKYSGLNLQQKNSVKKNLQEKYDQETHWAKKQILELFLKNINI